MEMTYEKWAGEEGRKPRVRRPCECGCSDGPWVGYLSGSTPEGVGITFFMPDEDTYQICRDIFGGEE